MKASRLRAVGVAVMAVLTVLISGLLTYLGYSPEWLYFAIMIAAADQISTVVTAGTTKVSFTLMLLFSTIALVFLPGPTAFLAIAGGALLPVLLGSDQWYKRLVSAGIYVVSAFGMVSVYSILGLPSWPSIVSALGALAAVMVFDVINVLGLSTVFKILGRASWGTSYALWEKTWWFSVVSAVAGLTVAYAMTSVSVALILVIPVASVLFLKPSYVLRSVNPEG